MAGSYIEMEIREIQTSDDPRDLPIIVLAEKAGDREFPIFVGPIEARALEDAAMSSASQFTGFPKRPLTYDLIANIMDGLSAKLISIKITRLEEGTFYGALELSSSTGSIVEIDSRPSDAMVLAMKIKVPIFVEENVLAEVQRNNPEPPD